MKMSEVRASLPPQDAPSPSQIDHAPRGSMPRSIRRAAAKAKQQGATRRTRKAQARILRGLRAVGDPLSGATAAQRRIAGMPIPENEMRALWGDR